MGALLIGGPSVTRWWLALCLPIAAACSESSVRPTARADAGSAPATIRVLATADVSGALLPCGCRTGPLGGAARRVRSVRDRGAAVVLDAGDHFFGQAAIPGADRAWALASAEALADVMASTKVAAMAVGDRDLAMGLSTLRALARRAGAGLLAANLAHAETGTPAFAASMIVGGLGIIGASVIESEGLVANKLAPAVRSAALELQERGARRQVLLLHGSLADARSIGAGVVDAILIPGGDGDAAQRIFAAGSRGRSLLALTIAEAVSADRLLLTDRLPEDPATLARIARPPSPSAPGYAGSAACRQCHRAAFDHWRKTGHAKAMATLRKHRQTTNRDCLGCHMTGFSRPGGPTRTVGTERFRGVGCESCHGGGDAHIITPEAAYGAVSPNLCTECHVDQADQRPFIPADRWQQILGSGHGR